MADELRPEDADEVRVTLLLDNDEELECQPLTIFSVGEQDYIVLLPLDDRDDLEEDEVIIYRYSEDENGEGQLTNIEDDDEYEAVADKFDEILDEMLYDEIDDGD